MAHPARQRISFEEYVRIEAMSPIRHEWLDGSVWAMAGGTPDHAAIAVNVSTQLANQLRGKARRVFGYDLRIRVRPTGLGTYPDVVVICGKVQLDPQDASGTTATNPKLIVEVLSPSTEKYDRGEKLDHYKKLTSLEEIVLVAHDARRLEVWRRTKAGWRNSRVEVGVAELSSVGCELSVAETYRDPLS
jgi:Uma2 family endonuclease